MCAGLCGDEYKQNVLPINFWLVFIFLIYNDEYEYPSSTGICRWMHTIDDDTVVPISIYACRTLLWPFRLMSNNKIKSGINRSMCTFNYSLKEKINARSSIRVRYVKCLFFNDCYILVNLFVSACAWIASGLINGNYIAIRLVRFYRQLEFVECCHEMKRYDHVKWSVLSLVAATSDNDNSL